MIRLYPFRCPSLFKRSQGKRRGALARGTREKEARGRGGGGVGEGRVVVMKYRMFRLEDWKRGSSGSQPGYKITQSRA